MKRLYILIFLILFILTGCNNINLTDEQYEKVGNTLGYMVIKYDKKFPKELETTLSEKEGNNLEELSKDALQKENTEKATQDNESLNNIANDIEENTEEIEDKIIKMSFSSYDILRSYPEENSNDVYVFIEAIEGTKLLSLNFQITNMSTEKQKFSKLNDKSIIKLLINNTYLTSPIQTLLKKDILSMDIDIEPGQAIDGVMTFQVPDDVIIDINNLVLLTTYNGKTVSMKLK